MRNIYVNYNKNWGQLFDNKLVFPADPNFAVFWFPCFN